MKFSVIVPAYNSEKYIAETLECLIAQSLGDIEIIVVNDGSTDSTPEIIDLYCAKHGNIRRVDQVNSGVSTARNRGLEEARGEFVLFIDADDLIGGNTLELFYNRMTQSNADIGICAVESFGYGGRVVNPYAAKLAVMDKIDVFDKLLLWNFVVSNKCYRRQRLVDSGVRFPLLRYTEDGAFFFRYVLLTTPEIIGVDGAVMRYRHHYPKDGFSATQSVHCELVDDGYKSLTSIYDCAVDALARHVSTCSDADGYLQEVAYKAEYITVLQLYRLIWQADDKAVNSIRKTFEHFTALMTDETLKKTALLYKDIAPVLCFSRAGLAEHPYLTAIIPNASPEVITSVYLQSMPSFELFVNEGTVVPEAWKDCENLHILPSKGFKAAARKAAKGEIILVFRGKAPLSSKLFKIISLLKKSKKFGFFPTPLIKLGAIILAKIRDR